VRPGGFWPFVRNTFALIGFGAVVMGLSVADSPDPQQRGGAQTAGAGQHQGRRHQGLPLRAASQSDLRRDGGSLRCRDPAGTAAPAPQSLVVGNGPWSTWRILHNDRITASLTRLMDVLTTSRPVLNFGRKLVSGVWQSRRVRTRGVFRQCAQTL
jgi:hypothetical protein